MKKKGFTLVELLAVIAILAILVIIALPNIMELFNQSKQNSFETELKNIYKSAEQEWMKDSMFDTQNVVYARNKSANCTKELSLTGREEIEYYIEVDKAGKVIKYFATDGTYQYEYTGSGLKIEEIGYSLQVANLQDKDILTLKCSGAEKNGIDITDGRPLNGTNIGKDSSNNDVPNTIPSSARGLYKIMAEASYLDNVKSPFVTSSSGVDFSKISSDTNGKGVYEIASTKNDLYPIYYYRGAVNNNNVKFGGFCWKAVRTTNTGGVKLVYNGRPNASGHCTNTTGESTQIGTSAFNENYNSPAYAGYMYGTIDGKSTGMPYTTSVKKLSASDAGMKFGKSVTYSDGIYTLTNIKEVTNTNYNQPSSFNDNHYTCFSTMDTCAVVYYVYYIAYYDSTHSYIAITDVDPNGRELIDVVKERMFRNDRDSKAKTEIENWYRNNMTSYTSKLEDTVYCNDRNTSVSSGWNTTGSMSSTLFFSGWTRTWDTYIPSVMCERPLDKFTVSSSIGNGKLAYPVGLLTIDEIVMAGGKGGASNNSYYLYTNQYFWSSSPSGFNGHNGDARVLDVDNAGSIDNYFYAVNMARALRPVVSISKNSNVTGGDGSAYSPYAIE